MSTADSLARGRDAFERRAWRTAYEELTVADAGDGLPLEDLERLAQAAYLIGHDDVAWLVRAHHEAIRTGQPARAARAAFWLGLQLTDRGEHAQAGGWIARARRLLDGAPPSVEQGYLLLPTALQALDDGDPDAAGRTFEAMERIAERFADQDLLTLARLGQGQAMIRRSEVERGMASLDEAMVAVTADEVSPIVVGIVYCSVIETCHQLFDLRRAQEWTDALARWCATQPDLVPYRGQCLLHRAELLQLEGSWADAALEARRAHEWLSRPPPDPAAGAAAYQEAELHRLRGDHARAAERYLEAGALGHPQEPGAALSRLAQGDRVGAARAIRRALDDAGDPIARPRLLEACVEVMLDAGEVAAAASAAAELAAIAGPARVPMLTAIAERAEGAVRLAGGRATDALPLLRHALRHWREVQAPYEEARTRTLVARACRALGDDATAIAEVEAAHAIFARLGARPDLDRLDRPSDDIERPATHGLTARELEILRLVATGRTNRAIADELVISEKTVARHLANIFTKLDVSTRSAATAYAYAHGLVPASSGPT